MKALTLYEPWATLVALGLKRYETRSWQTDYRGPLLICASSKKIPFIEIAPILFAAKLTPDDLSYGRAVAIVDLDYIIRTGSLILGNWERVENPEVEKKFGDWSPGRFAWKFKNIRRFKTPPWIRGKQGLFYASDFYDGFETYDPI